jgi:hypothetical protein
VTDIAEFDLERESRKHWTISIGVSSLRTSDQHFIESNQPKIQCLAFQLKRTAKFPRRYAA